MMPDIAPRNGAGLAIPNRGSPLPFLLEQGRNLALVSQAVEPREEHITSLTSLARAYASFVGRAGFNPAGDAQDGIRQTLFQKACTDGHAIEEMWRIAGARLREFADGAARKRAAVGPKPDLPIVAMTAAVGVLAISVAPTLHDFVFHTVPDELLNWFLSIVVSAVMGVMLAWGLFAASAARSRTPILVGVVISVGLGVLRLSAAEELREYLFTAGLTLMEIGVVLFLDWRARIYNEACAAWVERDGAAAEAEASHRVQERELGRLSQERQSLRSEVSDHLSYVGQRDELAGNEAAREQAYIAAVCDSYLQAIAENRGRLQRFE